MAARERQLRENAIRAYPKLDRTVRDHLAARAYDQAQKLIAESLADPKLAAVHHNVRDLETLARASASFWAKVVAGVEGCERGEPIRVDGMSVRFEEFKDGIIHFRRRAVVAGKRITKLKAKEALEHAQRAVEKARKKLDGAFFLECTLFLAADRQDEPARRSLERAKREGADTADTEQLLKRLRLLPKR